MPNYDAFHLKMGFQSFSEPLCMSSVLKKDSFRPTGTESAELSKVLAFDLQSSPHLSQDVQFKENILQREKLAHEALLLR